MVLRNLHTRVMQARSTKGIRAAASEIGISPTTLSKVERGHMPDMKTINKLLCWLRASEHVAEHRKGVQIAFKKDSAMTPETANSLAVAIQLAHRQFVSENP